MENAIVSLCCLRLTNAQAQHTKTVFLGIEPLKRLKLYIDS